MSFSIALAGNPNSGKTTLFNALSGQNQYVGNWPGVTVEKKEARLRGDKEVTLVDLPGVYSLSPYSPEEVVSRDYLLSGEPKAILNVVDATNLERNLYLTTQLLEVGLPVVVALNMSDIIRKNGDSIDIKKLSAGLGCPVVEISALKNEGTEKAAKLAAEVARQGKPFTPVHRFSDTVEKALGEVSALLQSRVSSQKSRWYAVKVLERDEAVLADIALSEQELKQLETIIAPVESEFDDDTESIITGERYELISQVLTNAVHKKQQGLSTSDKIDRVVTNRWLALPIFVLVMVVVYYISVMSVGSFVTDWTNDTLFGGWITDGATTLLANLNAAPWLSSLVVDGIIGGVGAVLGFVPQMVILFLLLSFLEDCGYMARVAFIMDRIFRKFGLSGKSFIPMLISSGCGVPGIMATKTIENEKDRRMTIITTTFIPCGAKLPIIALIGGALLGGAWWAAPLIYFVGVAAVIISGIILKKTKLFAGDPAPFVMELPQYHLPAPKSLLMHVWERARSFIVKAGTVIFASSIVIWFLLSFGFTPDGFGMVEDAIELSLMARLGSLIAPIFAPLGFGNWEATVGTITGLVAKENLVSTLAIVQGLSGDVLENIIDETQPMWAFMATILPGMAAGLSFLIFNMLCAPCFAAIGAIRRQMGSLKWTLFAVGYQTVFAYCIALMVYQFGSLLTGGAFGIGTIAAILVLALFLFLLFRPTPRKLTTMRRAPAGN